MLLIRSHSFLAKRRGRGGGRSHAIIDMKKSETESVSYFLMRWSREFLFCLIDEYTIFCIDSYYSQICH